MSSRNGQRVPRYCRSRNSAVVYLDGRCVYLGPFGSEKSRAAYARVLAEHAAGKRIDIDTERTIVEVIHAFWMHAKGYYVKDGKSTSEVGRIRTAMRPLKALYPALRTVSEFVVEMVASRWWCEVIGGVMSDFGFASA